MTFNRLTGGSSYEPWQIVGVMPRHFTYPLGRVRETEVYIPLASSDVERSRWTGVAGGGRFGSGYEVIGRLRPGVSFAQAAERMNVAGGGHRRAESEVAAGSAGAGEAAQ